MCSIERFPIYFTSDKNIIWPSKRDSKEGNFSQKRLVNHDVKFSWDERVHTNIATDETINCQNGWRKSIFLDRREDKLALTVIRTAIRKR